MDFFEQQAIAHRKTKWLVIYFIVAVAAMILAIYLALMLVFAGVQNHHRYYDEEQPSFSFWNSEIFFGVSLTVIAIVGIGSAYKTAALAAGGSAVSELMGGRLLATNTTNPDERKLLD